MGAYAYYRGHFDDKDVPKITASSTVRPGKAILGHWGRKLLLTGCAEYDSEDHVSWKCLERAHHEIPYTFEGFKAWLQKEGIVFEDYNADYFKEWTAFNFDKFRDFVRFGAIHRIDARMET